MGTESQFSLVPLLLSSSISLCSVFPLPLNATGTRLLCGPTIRRDKTSVRSRKIIEKPRKILHKMGDEEDGSFLRRVTLTTDDGLEDDVSRRPTHVNGIVSRHARQGRGKRPICDGSEMKVNAVFQCSINNIWRTHLRAIIASCASLPARGPPLALDPWRKFSGNYFLGVLCQSVTAEKLPARSAPLFALPRVVDGGGRGAGRPKKDDLSTTRRDLQIKFPFYPLMLQLGAGFAFQCPQCPDSVRFVHHNEYIVGQAAEWGRAFLQPDILVHSSCFRFVRQENV